MTFKINRQISEMTFVWKQRTKKIDLEMLLQFILLAVPIGTAEVLELRVRRLYSKRRDFQI